MELFTSTLSQMLVLFLFIAIGFVLQKTKIVPESGAGVISKLVRAGGGFVNVYAKLYGRIH